MGTNVHKASCSAVVFLKVPIDNFWLPVKPVVPDSRIPNLGLRVIPPYRTTISEPIVLSEPAPTYCYLRY